MKRALSKIPFTVEFLPNAPEVFVHECKDYAEVRKLARQNFIEMPFAVELRELNAEQLGQIWDAFRAPKFDACATVRGHFELPADGDGIGHIYVNLERVAAKGDLTVDDIVNHETGHFIDIFGTEESKARLAEFTKPFYEKAQKNIDEAWEITSSFGVHEKETYYKQELPAMLLEEALK